MAYREDVEAAAKALVRGDEANWELARLTYENTNSQTDRSKKTMAEWTADIRQVSGRRFTKVTGDKYKRMWIEHGTSYKSTKLSWTECWTNLTPRDAAEPMRARAARKHLEEATPSEAAETIKKALDRPEVARQIVADREANVKLAKARQEHDAESAALSEARDPELRDARKATEAATLNHEVARLRNLLFSSTGMKATEDTIELVRELIAAAQAFLDAQDFDAQLAHMIEGETK